MFSLVNVFDRSRFQFLNKLLFASWFKIIIAQPKPKLGRDFFQTK